MTIADIKNWFNTGKPYAKGVAIYEQLGGNETLKKLFAQKETAFNKRSLEAELAMLLHRPNKQLLDTANFKQHTPTVHTPIDISALPEVLQKQNVRKGELYIQATRLHEQLTHLSTDQERFDCAKKILDNFEEIKVIWADLDYFQANKQLPEKYIPKTVSMDTTFTIADMERLRNLRTYLSKHKNNPKRQQDIKHWQIEVAQLEKKKNGSK